MPGKFTKMPMPMPAPESEEMEDMPMDEAEASAEAPAVDLSALSDDELMAEVQKRGLA